MLVGSVFQVRAHPDQDRLNSVRDGVDPVDGQLSIGIGALVQIRLGGQPRRVQIPALVRVAYGFLVLVQLVQRSPGQDITIRSVDRFHHEGRYVEGRGKSLVHQIAQVEDGPARLR